MSKDNKDTQATSPETTVIETRVLTSLQEQIAALAKQVAENSVQIKENAKLSEEETERQPAKLIRLATYKGAPITKMRLVEKTAIDGKGQTVINGMEAICSVVGIDKEVKITYGDMKNPEDYLNLPRKDFEMTDFMDGEEGLSGASRIERNKVVATQGTVPENILSSDNALVPTGRMIPVTEKRNVRYYTIIVNGEKVELSEDNLYR